MQVTSDVGKLLGEHKVDAIVCVAGGWAGGNSSSKGKTVYLGSFLVLILRKDFLSLAEHIRRYFEERW